MSKAIKAYDTSALLDLSDNLVIDSTCYISTLVISELENIKVSFSKDTDVKAKARQVVRILKQTNFMTNTADIKKIERFSKKYENQLPNNNDSKILLEAYYQTKWYKVEFYTGDFTLYIFAQTLFKNDNFTVHLTGDTTTKRFWDGCVVIEPTEEQWNLLYSEENVGNIFNLRINEYGLLKKDNKIEAICRWDGANYVHLGYKPIKSTLLGNIEPRNVEQKCYFDLLQNPNIPIVNCVGRVGSGKAMPDDTLIPTPLGDRLLKEIQVGDYVFDRTGSPTKVLGVYPQGELDAYEVTFSDGRKTICNNEHLWSVFTCCGNLKTITLQEMIDNGLKLSGRNGYRYKIPLNKPVEYPEKSFKVHPYLVGLFLGDGCCLEPALTLSSSDEELPAKVSEILKAEHYGRNSEKNFSWLFYKKWRGNQPRGNTINQRFQTKEVFSGIEEYIIQDSYNKAIPPQYLEGSIQQRYELLRGLMDTDGSIDSKKGRIRYTTVSKKLAKQVCYLVNSLGMIATIREDKRTDKYKYGVCYDISIQCSKVRKQELFNLKRKKEIASNLPYTKTIQYKDSISIKSIKKLNYTTPMTCLYVDNPEHLFLTNDYIVTHNTFLATAVALDMIESGYYDKLIYVRNNFGVEDTKDPGALPGDLEAKLRPFLGPLIDIVGDEYIVDKLIDEGKVEQVHLGYLRGRSLKNCVVLVDESQNLTPSHIKMLISRMAENSKLIFCGDYSQADSKIFRNQSNGLLRMNERLQNNKLYGQIRLNKIERSEICQMADLLD